MELFIDPEFRELIPALSAAERAGLEESIKLEGCRDALVVWRDGKDTLLDGHNRYEICQRLNLPFQVQPITLASRDHARLWIQENQLNRRNLSEDQRAALAFKSYQAAAALARKERATTAATARWAGKCLEGDVPTKHPRLRTAMADKAAVSEDRFRRVAEIAKHDPKLVDTIARGELTIIDARRDIRRAENIQKLESIEIKQAKELAGIYDVIVVDPPWPLERSTCIALRPDQIGGWAYPTMPLDEIERLVGAKLAKHAAADCHVWLWTVQKYLPAALKMLETWELKYVLTMVWHKNGGFQPFGLPQFNCEFAIYARKGTPVFIDTKAFPTCFSAPRGANSEKPKAFYEVMRRVTGGRRLDMFNRREIPGFETWGKEAA